MNQQQTYIKKIYGVNFQCYREVHLQLHPGINVICGQSDSGKSSVVRMIRWAAENKPDGDSIRSNFATGNGNTLVRITDSNDAWIARMKGKGVNQYEASFLEEPIKVLKKYHVPEEISSFLNLGPINMQYQMDSPFLLSSSSSDVAQFLNKTAQLDVIDRATSFLRKQKLANEERKRANKIELGEVGTSLKRYEHIPDTEAKLKALEAIQSTIRQKQQQTNVLSALLSDTRSFEEQRDKHAEVLDRVSEPLNDILTLEKDLRRVGANTTRLSAELNTARRAQEDVGKLKGRVSSGKRLIGLKTRVDELTALRIRSNSLRGLLQTIRSSKEDVREAMKRKEMHRQELENTIPDVCPMCKRPGWRKGIN